MKSACINKGGPASRISITYTPQLDQPIPLDTTFQIALDAWGTRPGEIVTLCGPQNDYYRARFLGDLDGHLSVIPFEQLSEPAESPLHLTVIQALPQRERFELILEKLTEIGVQRFIPCETEHSITLDQRDAVQKKSHRWPHVIQRAARQCRRAELPELFPVVSIDSIKNVVADCDMCLLLKEGQAPWRLRELIRDEKPNRVALFIGPEGGFSDAEVDTLAGFGFVPVSLGTRVLRTETAAIVGATLLQQAFGDLG